MTKPEPVCGAITHKKTPCQNTLVTGCGLCPVHASQLRAANAGFKHRARGRRKKLPAPALAQHQPTPSTIVTDPIPLHQHHHPVHHTPVNPRPIPPSDAPPILPPDPQTFLYNITPIPPVPNPQPDFYTPEHSNVLQALKNGADALENVLKQENMSMVSPVTPKTPETNMKTDLFSEEERDGKENDSPPPDNILHASPDSYLLSVDLSMDLPVPKFD